ncbi:Phenylacetic acid catabolic protein [Geobacillus subterraneus]|uniref:Phenylacetic acid catabolic protein n=1 Tax=Geobacillus subterraneus TaxID=129338 RepID=UPI001608180D
MSKHALITLIEGIADNKFVLGDRLAKVGFSAPDVESMLASIAMAQGELGHARLLYWWTFDLNGHVGKKPDIKNETGKSFKAVRETNGWIQLIANFYVINTAIDVIFESLVNTDHKDVVSHVNKLFLEHKEHCIYSENRAIKLLNDQGAVPKRFENALRNIVPEVEQWLKEIEETAELHPYFSYRNLLARFQHSLDRVWRKEAVTDAK